MDDMQTDQVNKSLRTAIRENVFSCRKHLDYAVVYAVDYGSQGADSHHIIIILFYFGTVSTTSCRQLFILTVGSYILFILPSFCLKLFISKISTPPRRLNSAPPP